MLIGDTMLEPWEPLAERMIERLEGTNGARRPLKPAMRERLMEELHAVIDKVRKEAAHAATATVEKALAEQPKGPTRERLPSERESITKVLRLMWDEGDDFDVYVIAGMYPDGRLGEFFLRAAREGGALAGALDAFAIAVSIGLQHGIPLETYADKFIGGRFEPSGFTKDTDPDLKRVSSPFDYLFKWLRKRFSKENT